MRPQIGFETRAAHESVLNSNAAVGRLCRLGGGSPGVRLERGRCGLVEDGGRFAQVAGEGRWGRAGPGEFAVAQRLRHLLCRGGHVAGQFDVQGSGEIGAGFEQRSARGEQRQRRQTADRGSSSCAHEREL